MKKVLIAIVVLIAAGIGTAVWLLQSSTGTGSSLRNYLGAQIVGIANSYLVPQLDFDSLDYQAPYTIRVSGAELVAPDGTRVLDVETLIVTLAELPKIGQPIVIRSVAIERGDVNLIADGNGGFRGLSPIAKANPLDENEEQAIAEPFRLSSVLNLREVRITDATLIYDDASGEQPMRLDHLDIALQITPDGEHGPGWYNLDFTSGRKPGLTLDVKGRANIDTFDVVLDDTIAGITLDEQTRASLPGRLQSLLNTYEVRGAVEATITGSANLTQPLAADASVSIRGRDMNLAVGEYRFPLQSLALDTALASRILSINTLKTDLLAGSIDITGRADLNDAAMPATLDWSVADIDLQEFLRSKPTEGQPPKIAGIINAGGTARADLQNPAASLGGDGSLAIRDGRLVALPIVTELSQAMDAVTGRSDGLNHKLDADFTLKPGAIEITKSEITTSAIAARATGDINLDGTLSLNANAGPLEKLQSMLGRVGDIIGAVTDRLITYRIRGTLAEPSVSVAPLGIGD